MGNIIVACFLLTHTVVIVVVVERSEMFTYDGNDLQVSLVRAFSHDEFFHDAVRSVGSEQRLLITWQQQASVTVNVIQQTAQKTTDFQCINGHQSTQKQAQQTAYVRNYSCRENLSHTMPSFEYNGSKITDSVTQVHTKFINVPVPSQDKVGGLRQEMYPA